MSSKNEFVAKAGALVVKVGDTDVIATPKEFSTGSVGWNFNGKATIMVNGQPIRVQVTGNAIAIGSKDWAK